MVIGKREVNYELFKHKKLNTFKLFVKEKGKIVYCREYNDDSQSQKTMMHHLNLLRVDFSPIKMEWQGNLCNDIWIDIPLEYQNVSREDEFVLVEDGKFKFYE